MTWRLLGVIALAALAGLAGQGPAADAGRTPVKVVYEAWWDRHAPSGKIGWAHHRSVEETVDGVTLIRTTQRGAIKYIRSGDPYSEEDSNWSLERSDGTVVELGYRSALGKTQFLTVRGRPGSGAILLRVLGADGESSVYSAEKPWADDALGLYAQERFLEGRRLDPGNTFSYRFFQGSLNECVSTTITVLGPQKTLVRGVERELIAARQTFQKELYYDPITLYIDPLTGQTVKTEEDSATFGKVVQELVPRDVALAAYAGDVKDVEAPIEIDKPLSFRRGPPRELRVRVQHSSDDDLATLFPQDSRQRLLGVTEEGVELKLLARADPEAEPPAQPPPGPEFLASNFYIRSDDEQVIKHAREAVADTTAPRRQMRLIRQWVRRKVKGDYEVPFATADEVARTLEGDCTEMGVLAAAMGRAVGIPTRVAFGLVYDPENPGFGGHLWTEAFVEGRWEIFDATGVVHQLGAAYLKIGDYSMKDMLGPDEAVAVRRAFAGRMKVTVLEAK
ncbi:MAG TPA: transglutaminase-like domain-containing protein [Gemmatales bacterium]|nr:transglutaminase-like domain-containing protein [Gemmatales bacterium]